MKICPLKQATMLIDPYKWSLDCNCIEDRCAWWTEAYTTERKGYTEKGCAIKILAMKNADGRIEV